MSAGPEWGPLARLEGIWEGDSGEDVAYSNEKGSVGLTPYREHTELKPFGPVENGIQTLYSLDYRMAAWLGNLRDPVQPVPGRAGADHPLRSDIDVRENGVFSYEEVSLIVHGKLSEQLSHTDSNTLYRIADA